MKRLLNLTLCIILLVTPCFATYPAPRSIKKCPQCGQTLSLSHAVRQPVYRNWTDGKTLRFERLGKWIVQSFVTPELVKCPKCAHVFWIEDAEEVGHYHYMDDGWMLKDEGNKWIKVKRYDHPIIKEAVFPLAPNENDYYKALIDLVRNKKDVEFLRIGGWQAANDNRRFSKDQSTHAFSSETIKNMQALSFLFDENDENERLMKAEIARELGRFNEAISLLHSHFTEGRAKNAAFIEDLCKSKDTLVREIPSDRISAQ